MNHGQYNSEYCRYCIERDTNTRFNYKFTIEERIKTIVMLIKEKSLHN